MKTLQEIIMEKVKEQSAFPFYGKNSKNYKSNMDGVGDEFYLANSIKIVKKSGTQQVEIVKGGHIGVGNKEGFLSNWITVYRDGKWASDGTFKLNKGIIDFLDKNASKVKKMADEIKYAKNSVEESKKTYVANIEHTRTGEKRSVKFTTSRSPKVEASKLLKALEWVKSIDTVSEDVSVVEGAKLELWDEVNLATHWLSALVNGDSSGLSDEEEEQLDKWESKLPKGYTLDYGDLEDTDFKIDVVSGLRATTVRVKIYAQGK